MMEMTSPLYLASDKPGRAPGSAVTFFCFAKRKSPKKRRAEGRAAARFLALLAPGGVGLNSAVASNNARPDPPAAALLSPATRPGLPTANPGSANALPASWWCLAINAVMRRRVAQGQPDQGWRCLSQASLARPRLARATQCARRADAFGSPSLCLLSFGEARESESPAGARPGLPPVTSKCENPRDLSC
jgi:hypothetical protein